MSPPPKLNSGNAAVIELAGWLAAERERVRSRLETEADPREIALAQGRALLINELLRLADAGYQGYGE